MRGCLCTLYTDEFKPFIEPVKVSLAGYAARSGMDFVHFENVLHITKSPSWNKLYAIICCFQRGYEWVLWADADSLASRIAPAFSVPGDDLVTNGDENGICMSHTFIRNTGDNQRLIETLLFLGDVRHPEQFGSSDSKHEQNALKAVIKNFARFNTPSVFPSGFVVPIATHPHWENNNTAFFHLCSMGPSERKMWTRWLLENNKVA